MWNKRNITVAYTKLNDTAMRADFGRVQIRKFARSLRKTNSFLRSVSLSWTSFLLLRPATAIILTSLLFLARAIANSLVVSTSYRYTRRKHFRLSADFAKYFGELPVTSVRATTYFENLPLSLENVFI